MRFCIIGGANADIVATTFNHFVPNDSNPGTIRLVAGGVGRNIAHNLALLGNEVVFLSLFGGDTFGWFTADVCRKAKVKNFRAALRGVSDVSFFLFRLQKIYA